MSIAPEAVEYHIFSLPTPLVMVFVTWGILFVLSIAARSGISLAPRGLTNAFEMVFDFVLGFADRAIGERAREFYPLFIGIFLFVLVGNFIGLIPGLTSPTSNINITLALALITFCYYHFQGIKVHGLKYIRTFMGPRLKWYLFPINLLMLLIELISHTARIISLSLRLFINIFAKEVLLGILASLLVGFFLGPTLVDKGLSLSILILYFFEIRNCCFEITPARKRM
jgi:F-type H+-transporting ATPase subunit a